MERESVMKLARASLLSGIKKSGAHAASFNIRKLKFDGGTDGTRTRDLRRDRPAC